MRSGLMMLAPASWVILSIRPSTWSGTPESIRSGGLPSLSGHACRTSSWLAPIPPEVTITAGALISNSPTGVRELASPRATELGSSTVPATPASVPPFDVSESTWWRNFRVTLPRATASRTRRSNGSPPPGPGPPARGRPPRGPDARTARPRRGRRPRRCESAEPSSRAGWQDSRHARAIPGSERTGRPGHRAIGASRRRQTRRRPPPIGAATCLRAGRNPRSRASPGARARASRGRGTAAARACRRGTDRRATRTPVHRMTVRAPGRAGSRVARRRRARPSPRGRRGRRRRRSRLPAPCSSLGHLLQLALLRRLVLAPAEDLRPVADAPAARVVEGDLDDELGAQGDPLELALALPTAGVAGGAV